MFFRYPGGKRKLTSQIMPTIEKLHKERSGNGYSEPFFGGGAVGIEFMKNRNEIDSISINDKDIGLSCLWTCVIKYPEELKRKILRFKPSIDGYYAAKIKLLAVEERDEDNAFCLQYGFMKLAIHQISYSGLGTKSGGPLGGKEQKSKCKIDSRWSPLTICKKIDALHAMFASKSIAKNSCTCLDFEEVIARQDSNTLMYLDPPYYAKGNALYQHGFLEEDHRRLANLLNDSNAPWVLSYDDCETIRELYEWANIQVVEADYSIANTAKQRADRQREKRQELIICR